MQPSPEPALKPLPPPPQPVVGRILTDEDADADAVHLIPVLMKDLVLPNRTRHRLHDPTVGGAAHLPSANGAVGTTHHMRIEEEEVVDANSVLSSRRPVPLQNRQMALDQAAGLRRLRTDGRDSRQRRKRKSPLSTRLSPLRRT